MPLTAVVHCQQRLCPLTPDEIGQSGSPTGMIALSSTEIISVTSECLTGNSFA